MSWANSNLYHYAYQEKMMDLADHILEKNLDKITRDRYRMIRNAIFANDPDKAMRLLQPFPTKIQWDKIDVSMRGGEL